MTDKSRAEPAQNRARRQDKIVADVKSVLEKYGYLILNTPIYEQYDLLKETAFDFSDESIIRFLDRNTGKSLVLRPDFTPQVARTVTGFMGDYPLPLRLYYMGAVFRNVALDGGHKSEEYQIGWELIGGAELCGDLEMLLLADDTLSRLCLKDYGIVVGDSKFLSRVMELSGDENGRLQKAVAGKQIGEIEKISQTAGFSKELKELIKKLPTAFGGTEEAKKLSKLVTFDKTLSERVEYILEIFDILSKNGFNMDKIIFDAGETMGLGYYTGLNLKIVHHKSGTSLGGGGRYDNLMEKFGKTVSACGMALRLDELMRFDICEDGGPSFDYLAVGDENFSKAVQLRKEGFSVIFIADKNKSKDFLQMYKFKNVLGVGK